MYLLVARYYIVRALITPLGKKNAEKMGVHAKTTKQNKQHANAGDRYTDIYIYKLICELGFGRSNLL